MMQSMRGGGSLKIFLLMALIFMLIMIMVITFDYMGVFNLQALLPENVTRWLGQYKLVKLYIEKSRFYRMTPDQQVRELTRVYSRNLKEWGENLVKQEQDLVARASEMDQLKTQLAGISVELIRDRETQTKREEAFEQRLAEYEDGQKKLTELSKMYEKLEPAKAATIMDKLPEGLVVRIMRVMRTNKRAAVMTALDDKKAAVLTKLMSDEQERTFDNPALNRAKKAATGP